MLGFSLGQISALMASGALSDEDGFALLDVRARSMAQACEERPGAMYALLGAAHEDAQGICDECAQDEILVCANFNAPGQVVAFDVVTSSEPKRHGRAWESVVLA